MDADLREKIDFSSRQIFTNGLVITWVTQIGDVVVLGVMPGHKGKGIEALWKG